MLAFFAGIISVLASLSEVRTVYKEAINSSDKADRLVTLTEKSKSNAVLRAYYGTGLALQAKHSWNPATKLSKAGDAASELNAAVTAASGDLEVRFLRFSFEANVPDFLELSKHLTEDKKWILSHKQTTHAMWPTIRAFLLATDKLTAAEKKSL